MKAKDDVDATVLSVLKDRYFKLLLQEEYPHTPQVTALADSLEIAIRREMKG